MEKVTSLAPHALRKSSSPNALEKLVDHLRSRHWSELSLSLAEAKIGSDRNAYKQLMAYVHVLIGGRPDLNCALVFACRPECITFFMCTPGAIYRTPDLKIGSETDLNRIISRYIFTLYDPVKATFDKSMRRCKEDAEIWKVKDRRGKIRRVILKSSSQFFRDGRTFFTGSGCTIQDTWGPVENQHKQLDVLGMCRGTPGLVQIDVEASGVVDPNGSVCQAVDLQGQASADQVAESHEWVKGRTVLTTTGDRLEETRSLMVLTKALFDALQGVFL